MIAAAHAGCYSMAFSHALASAGFAPIRVATTASVKLEAVAGGFAITGIDLVMEAAVPNIDYEQFQTIAAEAKVGCPVSKALVAVPIALVATLVGE